MRKKLLTIFMACTLALSCAAPVMAEENVTTMENCGAYLFTWRPVDCGNGRSFAILVGGNTIQESDVILRRGYDYAYTLNSLQYSRPWGQVPDLVNVNGIWGIPENEALLPAGAQPVLRITLMTNNGNLATKERYVDVVALPGGVSAGDLPPEVRKYLINVDGSDAGAYNGTITSGWVDEADGTRRYRKPDGSYVSNSWLNVDDELYYMDTNGAMLKDTITPDGYYVDASGAWDGQPSTISASGPSIGPAGDLQEGWEQTAGGWKYRQTGGNYVSNGWFQAPDSKWYYFGIDSVMLADTTTPDGYHVDSSGAWDGQPAGTI